MRKVDKLGRIVIPLELRKKYGMINESAIEFIDVGEGVLVKAHEPFCKICRSRISKNAIIPLCEACTEQAAKSYTKNKKTNS